MLKEIDAASPEKTVDAINKVLIYLEEAGPSAKKFKESFEKTVEPLMKVNEELIKSKTNIRESAEHASALAAELMNIQTPANASINAARRNFDQISAIRKEGALKLQEFELQLNEKTNQDGVKRESELSAFKSKNQQEINDKIADFAKSQTESYRSSVLQNETKKEQLTLQEKILGLSEEGRLSAFNSLQLEQDLLTNANNYQEALRAIGEQRRKNIIDTSMAAKLEKEASGLKEQSDQIAYSSAERRQKSFIENQNLILDQDGRRLDFIQRTVGYGDREKKNAEALLTINDERERQLKGLAQLNDPILRVAKEKEIIDIFDQRIASVKKLQQAEFDASKSFDAGWSNAFANYMDNATNAASQANKIFSTFTQSMEDQLVSLFKTGKFGWKDFVQSMIDVLLRSQIQQMMAKILTAGSASSGGSLLGNIFGFRAEGGPVGSNSPYIVGEKGPELFVPNGSGSIVPNNQLAGNSTSVVYNINAVDAMSFKQMLAKDPAFLYSVTQMGARTMPGRA